MAKSFLMLFVAILTVSCSQQKQKNSQSSITEPQIDSTTVEEPVTVEDEGYAHAGAFEVEIQDATFAYDPFANSLQEILKTVKPYTLEKVPQENIHVENVVDTIVQIRFDNSSIDYFKSQDGNTHFIVQANINSEKVLFKKDIRVGMSLDDFKSRFTELKDKKDFKLVTIVGEDGLYVVSCEFENNVLVQVNFQGFLD